MLNFTVLTDTFFQDPFDNKEFSNVLMSILLWPIKFDVVYLFLAAERRAILWFPRAYDCLEKT
jgi:hypothetical protein